MLDYRVSSDQSSGVYVILAMMVHEKSYTATGLTAGNTYKFKVEARNLYGYSSYSEIATILCATNPSMPLTPTTTVVNDEVIVDWTAPSDQGTEILGYYLYVRQSDNQYTQELTHCDGSTA